MTGIWLVLVGLLASTRDEARGEPIKGWAAPLPLKAFENGIRTCSRPGPSAVTRYWQLSDEEVSQIDAALLDYLRRPGISRTLVFPPERYGRQYLGFLRGSRRFVYVNAFPADFKACRATEYCAMCDGGPSFWGIEYDVASRRFEHLERDGGTPAPPPPPR